MNEPLDAFRRLVHESPELRDELLAETDDARFAALAERRAAEAGLSVHAAHIQSAIREGRQAWHQRRI